MKYIVFLLVFLTTQLFGQDSTADGEWANVVSTNYTVSGGTVINIKHVVTTDYEIDVLFGGTLNVVTDSLIVNEGLVTFIGGNITINTDAVLFINGDLDNTLWGNITINGTLKVDGNVNNLGSNITLGEDAYLGVGGDLINNGGVIDNTNGGSIGVGGSVLPNLSTIDGGNVEDGMGSDVALPIELFYFYAVPKETFTILFWCTLSEMNNDYFLLEYSTDCQRWYRLAYVNGYGNTTLPTDYEYYHITTESYYYRLTQYDYDGANEAFDIIYVDQKIHPQIKYDIYDLMGRYITRIKGNEINNLGSGQYILYHDGVSKKIKL